MRHYDDMRAGDMIGVIKLANEGAERGLRLVSVIPPYGIPQTDYFSLIFEQEIPKKPHDGPPD